MSTLIVNVPANSNGWHDRHNKAVRYPHGMERPIILMLQAWELYAAEMKRSHEALVGEDGYCAEYWEAIGESIIKLLSGPVGTRLDLGTLDKFVREVGAEYGSTAFK